jgi:predicted ester cyclase
VQSTIEDIIAEGDRVVWRLTIRGTHRGMFRGIAPTGKYITITAMKIVRLANGQFVENWGEQDNLGLLQQLGVLPAPN